MNKLYPPYINGTIPAFTSQSLKIYFENNSAVSNSDIYGMQIILKDLYNINVYAVKADNYNLSLGVANFDLSHITLDMGSYYKIQLAYLDKNYLPGYYSTVGVTKFTTRPKVTIDNLAAGAENPLVNEYIGKFEQFEENDITEKLYSSYFIVYDLEDNIIFQSAEKIHNSSNDILSNEQQEILELKFSLPKRDGYKIQFCTTSLNGLKINSIKYNILEQDAINMDFNAEFQAENNYEEGYIALKFINSNKKSISGLFAINRINIKTEEKVLIANLRLNFDSIEDWKFKDYTIEQGQNYYYTIQQFSEKRLYSKPIKSNNVYADYEHLFLTDGKKQLKIKYNPKVSTFKANVLEQKNETIGNKYPFIFRNGVVNYKEFNISGLLSYLTDESNEFLNLNDQTNITRKLTENSSIINYENFKTNLTSSTIEKERQWKLNVLEWLNNGEVKLFKSATEGNYLVRLTNISLTPEDKLGRMLHAFQAVAYEVAEISPINLETYHILDLSYPGPNMYTWASWNLEELTMPEDYGEKEWYYLNTSPIFGLKIVDMLPGATIDILFANQSQYETILIGATGAYSLDNVEIESIRLKNKQRQGIISYKSYANNSHFDKIDSIQYYNSQLFTIFGDFNQDEYGQSLVYFLFNDPKYSVNKINYLTFEKRPIVILENELDVPKNPLNIYYKMGIGYFNSETMSYENEPGTYYIYKNNSNEIIAYTEEEFEQIFDSLYKIEYNNNEISLVDKISYKLPILEDTKKSQLKIGLGIKMDICLSIKEKYYNFEDKYYYLKEKRQLFLNSPNQKNYDDYISKLKEVLLKEGVNYENE